MKAEQTYTVTVEKINGQGAGICKIDDFVVFVENSCPEDKLNIKITKVNKNYATAQILEILEPSPHRIQPFCSMQKVCGACQLQYIDYDYQLELKRQITQDALRAIGNLDITVPKTIPSPEIKNYRCKIQYPISRTKNSQRVLAGYYKQKTHEIINIKHCPIQPEICDHIISFIREKAFDYGIKGFIEKNHTGDLRHVVIRHSISTGRNLVVLVINATKTFDRLNDFAKAIYEEFDEVDGVCLNYNSKKTNVILGNKTECVCGKDFVEENIIDKTFKIGADTFFQINPKSAENIFKYVKEEISKTDNPTVLDAYAGIATFGIVISDSAKAVVSVEENNSSIEKAKEVIESNKITNLEVYAQDTTKYLKSTKRKFDITILDPPRKGCTQEALDETLNHTTDKIIYVSCNPATLARDLKYLTEKGAKVQSVQPFDMFCHTYHVENVAIIEI